MAKKEVELSDPEEPVEAQAEDQVKKRAVGGGFNLFGGFNPAAVQLKKGRSIVTEDAVSPAVQLPDRLSVATWISGHVPDVSLDVEGDWRPVLKDGIVLAKLAKSLYPDRTFKVNTGRFPFMVFQF